MVFDALADSRRQSVLLVLAETDEVSVGLDSLVDNVARRLNGGEPSLEHHQHLRVGLHHNHLPKLDEYGIVIYDAVNKTVKVRADGLDEQVLSLLESSQTSD